MSSLNIPILISGFISLILYYGVGCIVYLCIYDFMFDLLDRNEICTYVLDDNDYVFICLWPIVLLFLILVFCKKILRFLLDFFINICKILFSFLKILVRV